MIEMETRFSLAFCLHLACTHFTPGLRSAICNLCFTLTARTILTHHLTWRLTILPCLRFQNMKFREYMANVIINCVKMELNNYKGHHLMADRQVLIIYPIILYSYY